MTTWLWHLICRWEARLLPHEHHWQMCPDSQLFVQCRCGEERLRIYDAPGPTA